VKIKLDENVHGDAQGALAARGHDVATVHDEDLPANSLPFCASPGDAGILGCVTRDDCRTMFAPSAAR
jgi:hypothetical protein